MKRLPWVKLWDDIFTTPSHADLDGDALLVLMTLMTFVRASCDAAGDWTPWALLPSGKPVSIEALARKARKSPAIAAASVQALVDAGTVEVRDDGAIGLPGFRRHQEGDSTPRAARCREAKRAREPNPPAPPRVVVLATSPVAPIDLLGGAERARHRAALAQDLVYGWNGNPPPQPKGLARLRATKGLDGLLESGMTPEDVRAAIDKVAELVEAGELPPSDWTSAKVFSGWLDGMLVKHAEWLRRIEAKRAAIEPEPESTIPVMDPELMAAAATAELQKMRGA